MAKILVLEDDEFFRQFLTILLERAGFETRTVADSASLEAALRTERFNAVITDLYMPGIDGIEVVRLTKRISPATPVIGVTSACLGVDDPCIRAMTVLGAEAVLCKPLDQERFFDVLCRAIRRNADNGQDIAATACGRAAD